MFFKALLRRIKNEKGSIIIMTAIALPLLLGIAGLGYDVGNLYLEKGRLQNIADASALAGAAVYRDVAKDAATSGTISVDENFDNTTYYTDRPGNLSNTAHGVADSAAWDYVEKNKGAHSISVNGPFALHGAVTGQTSEGTVTTKPEDGVYYRVRLSEEIPLHFLPLIPGIGHQQTVNAEAIVAISTETGSEAHTDVQASTEYVEIFDKMFSYNSMSNSVVPNTTDSSLIYSASNQINLRHYAYMLYMNHQWSNSSADVTKTLLSSNGKPSVWHDPVQHWEQNMVWVPNMVEVEDKEYVEKQVWIPNMVEVEDGYFETYYEWYDFLHLNPKQRWVKTGSHWEDHGHYEDQGYWQVTGTHMEDHGQYVDQGHYVTDQPGYWTLGTGTDDNYYSLNGYYNNNNSHYTEDMYYQSKLTEKMFVNVKLESPNDVTININENLSNSYYSYDGLNYISYGSNYNEYSTNARTQTNYNSQNGWTLSGNKRFRNSYYTYSRRNNTLGSSNLKKAFPIPMYIYRESSKKSETFNDTIINVTGNSNENCYPIVLYQYNKFDPKETNVEINISDGKIFRGIIFAPDSVVKINTNNMKGLSSENALKRAVREHFHRKTFLRMKMGKMLSGISIILA